MHAFQNDPQAMVEVLRAASVMLLSLAAGPHPDTSVRPMGPPWQSFLHCIKVAL